MKNETQKSVTDEELKLAEMSGHITRHVQNRDGKSETVQIRQVGIDLVPDYLAVYGDEAASIDFFCDKPSGWHKTLTRASQVMVMDAGEDLNLDFLESRSARRVGRQKRINPGQTEEIATMVMKSYEPMLREALAKLSSGSASKPASPSEKSAS
jgi:hypothetical protein